MPFKRIVSSSWPAYNAGHEGGVLLMVELLTSQELMKALKISRSTLVRLKKKGLPMVGAGKLARYNPEQALQWFHAHTQPPSISPKILPPGDYQCGECGFQGSIQRPTVPGHCPQCGSTDLPRRVNGLERIGDS